MLKDVLRFRQNSSIVRIVTGVFRGLKARPIYLISHVPYRQTGFKIAMGTGIGLVLVGLLYGSSLLLQQQSKTSNRQATVSSFTAASGANTTINASNGDALPGSKSSSSDKTSSNYSSTFVSVNGQPVNVPENGSYSTSISGPNDSRITVSGENSQTLTSSGGSASNSSSTVVNVNGVSD